MAISQDQFQRMVQDLPGLGRDPASVRRRIEAMEQLLEGLFVIPGTQRRVGLDSLIGLVPIVGDLVTAAMGGWMPPSARSLSQAMHSTFSTSRIPRICASSASIWTATIPRRRSSTARVSSRAERW
jgi:Domain of unknown function (DUF4112)